MRIASKINAALFGAFACGTLATYVVLNTTIQPRFDDIENASAQTNHKRVTDAFAAFTEKLKTATQDYAFWDQTYHFMQGEAVAEFVESNLTPEAKAVENLGVNALVFLRKDGEVLWGAAYDLESKEKIDGLVNEIAHFSRSHPQIGHTNPSAERGIIQTSKGLVLVAIAPVLKSDQSGEPEGKVISAKMLDVAAVKQLTGVEFNLQPMPHLIGRNELSGDIILEKLTDQITTKSVVKSLIGRPLALLTVSSSRDVSRAGAMAIRSATEMMVAAGLTALAVLWAFLSQTVVSRIGALKKHFGTAGCSGTIKPAAQSAADDEIGDLARSFNSMADQVNHLRDALADSAYMSGLSEWAAGTLHNVRNGLIPVATTTWQVEQLFDTAWLKNVETALAEHADAATATDRRTKLNAFLVGSAGRFVESAKRTTDLTGKINRASQSVLDMVTEFERYAHRKTEIETVDVLPLLKATVVSTIADRGNDVELALPAESATVLGNSIILRQIVSNIIVNALEAMADQPHRARIEVSIAEPANKAGYTQVRISDNGEGLASDRLTSIFQRGVSSRKGRSGGLGLHWCANAAKVLGGTIHAVSAGPGCGTTIVIELTNTETREKQAA